MLIADRFGAPGGRLYKTCDPARIRREEQRGFRIESPVEAVRRAYPSVTEAVVLVAGECAAERGHAAYFVPGGELATERFTPPSAVPPTLFERPRAPASARG